MTKDDVPTIDDLIELPSPREVQLSPDGSHLAYVVSEPNWKDNKYSLQVCLVATEEQSKPRQLTFAKESSYSPHWSPDGEWLRGKRFIIQPSYPATIW